MQRTLLLIIAIYLPLACFSQFNYTWSVKKETYQPLTGGISVTNGLVWDEETFAFPIGFTFVLDGEKIDTAHLLGPTCMISDTVGDVKGLWTVNADLQDRGVHGSGMSESPIQYTVTGTTGSRICKLEFANAGFWDEYDIYKTSDDYVNLQVWLYEGSNAIEFKYGTSKVSHPGDYFYFSGKLLAGLFGAQVNQQGFRSMYYLYGDPASPQLDSAFNSDLLPDGIDSMPAPGTVYRFEPKTTGISQIHHYLDKVLAYPTICTNELIINNNETGIPVQYRICTIQGQTTACKGALQTGQHTIDISLLPKSEYILYLEREGERRTIKLIKQ